MTTPRWTPPVSPSRREQFLLGRLKRTKKLFAFLRLHRHELFDDQFQAELEQMYRDTGEGKTPVPPALLAMVILLQAYTGASDAEAVELSIVDARWQLVLGVLAQEDPPFSQGALQAFRQRLIAHDMDRRLLERTVELARESKLFDWRKLPKTLRVAVDSRPLVGAGRVEDTVNLLAHAARKIIECAAKLLGWDPEQLAEAADVSLLVGPSIKRALDIEWSDPEQKADVIVTLAAQLDRLERWLEDNLRQQAAKPPLSEHVATLRQLREQDLEPDPDDGHPRIRQGVAEDRRVSVEDAEMRHGRKTKSKRFNGYKSHIAGDLDDALVLACAITPANRPEAEAGPLLSHDLDQYARPRTIGALYIDRGYISSELVETTLAAGGEVLCKPWVARNGKLFSKSDFKINMGKRTITCPAGEVEAFHLGTVVKFDADACAQCSMRAQCTTSEAGRSVSIAEDEQLQHRLRKLAATASGRERLRERVPIEHRLAHLARKQGPRARYRGVRKNVFDLRRHAAVVNLETIDRHETIAMAA